MRVLLDTNIIIHREASRISNQGIGVLFYWLDKLHYTKCVHPLTSIELQRNINDATTQTMQLKLMNYQVLLTPAPLHEDVLKISQKFDKVPNDFDDTRILNEVYSDRVDFLITEDKKIHLKAAELGIGRRVFRIDKFLEKVTSENPDFVDYKVLSVKKELFGNKRQVNIGRKEKGEKPGKKSMIVDPKKRTYEESNGMSQNQGSVLKRK